MKKLLIFWIPIALGAIATEPSPGNATTTPKETRPGYSVRLNNYNNWGLTGKKAGNGAAYDKALTQLARRDSITISEPYEYANDAKGWRGLTPNSIKAINPSAKVYRLYDLMCKNKWDSDWNKPEDTSHLQTPLSKAAIDANDWWLRGGNGDIVKESDSIWILDVGKPGFKEAYLQQTLTRMSGKGFDGIVFDYLWPGISTWIKGQARPAAYPTDDDWFNKAWKPFFTYVTDGLHSAGYRVIGNCAGEYQYSSPDREFQRSKVDGVVYEQWALSFADQGVTWLPGSTIERRIKALQDDPLELWAGDVVTADDPEYDRKQMVSLAMYYVAIPQSQARRSYHNTFDSSAHWQPIWDLNIGIPEGPPEKMQGRYFWSRKFTRGMVLLNYDNSPITYTLDRSYHDVNGKTLSGEVTLAPHTALILAVANTQ